jgi:hypothetical protein
MPPCGVLHEYVWALLCFFFLFSSHFQVKPTHSLHTTTDKLSRHAYTLPCPVRGGSYDAFIAFPSETQWAQQPTPTRSPQLRLGQLSRHAYTLPCIKGRLVPLCQRRGRCQWQAGNLPLALALRGVCVHSPSLALHWHSESRVTFQVAFVSLRLPSESAKTRRLTTTGSRLSLGVVLSMGENTTLY